MDSSYTNSFGQFGDNAPSSNGGMVSGNTNGAGPIVSGSNDAAPVMPSGDDIILTPSSNGATKKRRWPVVVAIVLFIVAIGAGVGAWIASQPWGKGTKDNNNLRRYANYVINGDENDNEIGDGYVTNRIYYVADQVYNAEETDFDTFYTEANSLIDNMLKVYNETDVANYLIEQQNMLKAFYIYKKYDKKITMDYYLGEDYSSLVAGLSEVAKPLEQSTNTYVAIYAEDIIDLTETIAQLWEIYYNAGCSDENVEELLACDLPPEVMNEYIEKNTEINTLRNDMGDMMAMIVKSYIKGVYEMLEVGDD